MYMKVRIKRFSSLSRNRPCEIHDQRESEALKRKTTLNNQNPSKAPNPKSAKSYFTGSLGSNFLREASS